jgi:PTH1 family peptidyl-tRNA hydrolase
MKLVVGLGNPGKEYEGTRHNLGYAVASGLARRHAARGIKKRFQAEVAEVSIGGHPVLLLTPVTYMNRSGQSVRGAVDFYKLDPVDLLVVCDDMNLPLGTLRYRARGSAGGQKGLADVTRHLGTEDFARLRLGIGRPNGELDPAVHVLQRFGQDERSEIERVVELAVASVDDWVVHGVDYCMNRYNAKADQGKGD